MNLERRMYKVIRACFIELITWVPELTVKSEGTRLYTKYPCQARNSKDICDEEPHTHTHFCGNIGVHFKPSTPRRWFVAFNLRCSLLRCKFSLCSLFRLLSGPHRIPWHGSGKNPPPPPPRKEGNESWLEQVTFARSSKPFHVRKKTGLKYHCILCVCYFIR